MTADDELINRVRDWGIRMGTRDLSWLTEGWPMLDHGTVDGLMSAPLAGARVDPPSRIEVALPEGMGPTPEQRLNRSQLEPSLPEISDVIEHLTAAFTSMTDSAVRAAGAAGEIVVASEGFSRDSDRVTMRVTARPRAITPADIAAAWRTQGGSPGFARRYLNARVSDSGWEAATGLDCPTSCTCDTCSTPNTSFSSSMSEVEDSEAVWLEILVRETEATGSPWAAAVNVFGASPPDAVSVGL